MSAKWVRGCKSLVHAASPEERFQLFFLSCTAPGVQLWFYLPLCMCATYRRLLPGLSQSTWSPRRWEGIKGAWACPGRRGQRLWLTVAHCPPSGRGQRWQPGPHQPTPAGAALVPTVEATGTWGQRLQWWLLSLHGTEQCCFTSVAAWAFSVRIPLRSSSRPFSGCLLAGNTRPFSGSALQTPCSASSPHRTGRHLSLPGACKAVAQTTCIDLTVSCLPQKGATLSSKPLKPPFLFQLIPLPLVRELPWVWEPPLLPRGIGPIDCHFSFSFFGPTWLPED